MEFFLDSAQIDQIKRFMPYGIVDGITTNPSILAKSSNLNNQSFEQIVCQLSQNVSGLISLEVTADNYNDMLIQGNKILSMAKNIMLKLPINWDGVAACKYFSAQGHKVNMTLCFSVTQGLLAAKAGAYCVSPFIGRLDDIGHDGLGFLAELKKVFGNYPALKTKILAASIRNISHVYSAAKIGVDIVTMPPEVMEKLINNPLTDAGIKQFENDWQKSNLSI